MTTLPWWLWAVAGIALVLGVLWYRGRNQPPSAKPVHKPMPKDDSEPPTPGKIPR
jgi:hypothetical protein